MEATMSNTRHSSADAPIVDVRPVLFTVSDRGLLVALREEGGLSGLPRAAPRLEEALDATAARILADEMGVAERYLEQLYSVAESEDPGWTVTVAYLCLALTNGDGRRSCRFSWFDVADLPPMGHLDRKIVDYALLRLRAKLGYTTIAFHLLPVEFSLSELQGVYEAVLGRLIDKRNFRRRIQAGDILEETGATRRDGSHRPARLFRFRAAHDADTYLTPAWAASTGTETTEQ
jgi:8-oxo-dGTP diphosphatase